MKKYMSLLLSLLLLAALIPGCAVAESEPVVMRLGGLKGPTTMGMVKLLSDSDAGLTANKYEYTIAAAADELTPKLLKGELDMLALPVNAGAILYNKSQGGVTMLAVNTLGVLYILEKGGETVKSVADLKGKTIYATGKGTTPEYALSYLLTANGLDIAKDVAMEWKSEPSEVVAQLAKEESAVALVEQFIGVNAAVAEKAIPACHIVCVTGEEMKAAAEGYLKVLFELNDKAVGGALPGEDFYYLP